MNLVLLVQICVVIIVVGVTVNLWRTTRAYGGVIGFGLKWIGLGIVFFSLEALDRVLGSLSFVNSIFAQNQNMAHNIILLLGLLFSGIGFSKLMKVPTK